MLAPTLKEQVTATLEVREVFNISKVGMVAGAMVKTGKVKRSDKARLIRDGIVVFYRKYQCTETLQRRCKRGWSELRMRYQFNGLQ